MVVGRGPGGAGGEVECFQCQGTYERTKNTNDHETKGPMYHITRSRDCCNAQQINHKGIRSFISRNSEQTVKALVESKVNPLREENELLKAQLAKFKGS